MYFDGMIFWLNFDFEMLILFTRFMLHDELLLYDHAVGEFNFFNFFINSFISFKLIVI